MNPTSTRHISHSKKWLIVFPIALSTLLFNKAFYN